jgi:hypothetical protein
MGRIPEERMANAWAWPRTTVFPSNVDEIGAER